MRLVLVVYATVCEDKEAMQAYLYGVSREYNTVPDLPLPHSVGRVAMAGGGPVRDRINTKSPLLRRGSDILPYWGVCVPWEAIVTFSCKNWPNSEPVTYPSPFRSASVSPSNASTKNRRKRLTS